MPPAALRSSLATSVATYAWRAGTSICEMEKRSTSTPIASGADGIRGTSMSSTLDGRWVKTITPTAP